MSGSESQWWTARMAVLYSLSPLESTLLGRCSMAHAKEQLGRSEYGWRTEDNIFHRTLKLWWWRHVQFLAWLARPPATTTFCLLPSTKDYRDRRWAYLPPIRAHDVNGQRWGFPVDWVELKCRRCNIEPFGLDPKLNTIHYRILLARGRWWRDSTRGLTNVCEGW